MNEPIARSFMVLGASLLLGPVALGKRGQFPIENRDSTTPHIKKVRVV